MMTTMGMIFSLYQPEWLVENALVKKQRETFARLLLMLLLLEGVCVCVCCRGSMSQGLARGSRGAAADATTAVQSEANATMNTNKGGRGVREHW